MKKVGRNDPCHCGSGKKFKKCCESKAGGKPLAAHKIEDQNAMSRAAGLSNLFKSQLSTDHKTPSTDSEPPPKKP
jgi:hypothetical protein